jgi:hypothetical protein
MTTTTLHEAILNGLKLASDKRLTKPDDISFAIQVAIDAASLKVIRTSRTNNFTLEPKISTAYNRDGELVRVSIPED